MKADSLDRVLATFKINGLDLEGEIYFAEFDKTIQLYLFSQTEATDYNKKCIRTFFKWSDDLFEKLKKASFDYYQDFVEWVDADDIPKVESSDKVFFYCYPTTMIFDYSEKYPNDTFITVELNCDWEIEHGMQWTVKNNNEIIFVGPFEGVSIDYADKIETNYARKYNQSG